MVDFVEEVEEQLRAERYATLAKRWLPWFAAALAATVVGWLGVWAYNSWQDQRIAAASTAYDKAITTLAGGDVITAYSQLDPVAKSAPAGYRTLALLAQGNIRVNAGKVDEAAALYDAAAKAAPNDILKDFASLRAAQTLMDTAPYVQIEARLKPLAADKRPYALNAREMLAMAKLQAGKIQEARGDFNALMLTLGVSQGMRARAQGAIALIDSGQAGVVGQVVKAAASLPPSAALNIPGMPGATSPGGPADAQSQGDSDGADSAPNPAGNTQ